MHLAELRAVCHSASAKQRAVSEAWKSRSSRSTSPRSIHSVAPKRSLECTSPNCVRFAILLQPSRERLVKPGNQGQAEAPRRDPSTVLPQKEVLNAPRRTACGLPFCFSQAESG